uniref:Uncharacterized protein n=1 Tax=Rhizophora mucronata TaxID=61149 RepID=A0A2P2NLW7_RHIMU
MLACRAGVKSSSNPHVTTIRGHTVQNFITTYSLVTTLPGYLLHNQPNICRAHVFWLPNDYKYQMEKHSSGQKS